MHVFLVRLQCDWIEEDQYIQKRQKVRAELEIKLLHHTLIIFFQPANYSLTFKACLFFSPPPTLTRGASQHLPASSPGNDHHEEVTRQPIVSTSSWAGEKLVMAELFTRQNFTRRCFPAEAFLV